MNIIKSIKDWANALTEIGVSLLALGIVLEVLFKGQNIPFWPNITVIDNVTAIITALSAQGLVGLPADLEFFSRDIQIGGLQTGYLR